MSMKIQRIKVTTRQTNNHLFSVSSLAFLWEVVDLEREVLVFFESGGPIVFLKQHLVEGWNLFQEILAKGEAKVVRFVGKWCNSCFIGKMVGGPLG